VPFHLSLRTGLSLPAVRLRGLRRTGEGPRLVPMDAPALLRLLMPERARFVRLAARRVAEADAEDVVQRALLRASGRAALLDDPSRARAWFYRILRRAIADHLRDRIHDPMKHRAAADLETLEQAPRAVPVDATCACTERFVSELRPGYAEVIRRVDVEGEEPRAVASALGISSANVHVRLHRARRLLRGEVMRRCGVSSYHACLDCECDLVRRCSDRAELCI